MKCIYSCVEGRHWEATVAHASRNVAAVGKRRRHLVPTGAIGLSLVAVNGFTLVELFGSHRPPRTVACRGVSTPEGRHQPRVAPNSAMYVQQSGHPGRKGGSDVTGRQVQGSQPV